MNALMVQGTSSWAGKSLLATALARILKRAGVAVAPFKAQNMSNNARVVAGGEIGTAQYLQALAAGVEPDVRMNPVLVKPEGDMRSQVVLDGRPEPELSGLDWRKRPSHLWPAIERAYRSLAAEYELILIEGAGSPAEINLLDTDLANMRVAELADARVLLVADVNRGGAFAHLYGTWALVEDPHRERIGGFVLNKFRGDPELIAPGPQLLEGLTGVPTLGVVPWLEHGLPDEDGVAVRPRQGRRRVAIVRYPTASNLDEFKRLEQVVDIVWSGAPAALDGADLVVLPGSKNVERDLDWLRSSGLADAVVARAAVGRPVLAICGGLQMLGSTLGGVAGLGLLPLATTYEPDKLTREIHVRLDRLPPAWSSLEGLELDGYEIRHGSVAGGETVFAAGSVLGFTFHGAFENETFVERLFGARTRSLEFAIDALADAVAEHLDVGRMLPVAAR
ncbi:MAG: cobyric acid synthase [Gaiellaceae bacterium]